MSFLHFFIGIIVIFNKLHYNVYIKRKIISILIKWKESAERKPLLLKGARQTGKTYCLENFGQYHFPQYHYFDFMENPELHAIFALNLNPSRIIRDLTVLIDKDIDLTKDLIIFDEIQECPEALTSLKYFAQEHPSSYICASGSLLGIGLNDASFPVGKVSRCNLDPMDFDEFLMGMGQSRLFDVLNKVFLFSGNPMDKKGREHLPLYLAGKLQKLIT